MKSVISKDTGECEPEKICVGSATAKGPDSFRAGADAAREALGQIGDAPISVVIVFAPVGFDLNRLLAGVHEVVGNAPVFGASSAGEICNGVHEKSVVVTVLASPYLKVRLGLGLRVSENWQEAAHRAVSSPETQPFFTPSNNTIWNELIHQGKSAFAVVFSPGSTRTADSCGHEILEELKRLSLGRLPIFGGSAADVKMNANYVFAGESAAPDSMVVAIFETSLRFGIAIAHGLKPTTSTAVVTKACGHEVVELDGMPAATAYSRLLGITRDALEERDLPLITGQPLGIRDVCGQYTVNMISYITSRGGLQLAQPVGEGTILTLMELKPEEMIAAGEDAMRKAMLRSGESDPALVITCDCILRSMILKDRAADDVTGIMRMAPNASVVGFYSFGEIGVSDNGGNRHSNKAISMLLLGRDLSYAARVAQRKYAPHGDLGGCKSGLGVLGARSPSGQPRQKRVSRTHEPRNSHTAERNHRHERAGIGHRSERKPNDYFQHNQQGSRLATEYNRRYPRFFQN